RPLPFPAFVGPLSSPGPKAHLHKSILLDYTRQRFLQDLIDNFDKRRLLPHAVRDGLPVEHKLAVGGGAATDNLARVGNLLLALQRGGILGRDCDYPIDQRAHRHGCRNAEIDELALDPETLRDPAVLGNQRLRIDAPALVAAAQAIEHAKDAAIERG